MKLGAAPPEDAAVQWLEVLQHALKAADVGVWQWDIASERVSLWGQARQVLGGGDEALCYGGFLACIHAADRERVDAHLRARPEAEACDIAFRVAAAPKNWVRLRGRFWCQEGRKAGARGVLLDVTAEKSREVVDHRLVAIVNSSEDAIVGETLEGIITDWNAGAEEIFG